MLLAIDIGNSNVTIGLYEQDNWLHIWRLPTMNESDSLMYYEVQLSNLLLEHRVDGRSVNKVVISSVVPDLRELFVQLSRHLFKVSAIVVGPDLYPQLPLKVLRPDELGTDLYANALAAYDRYQQACIITDFGTALTFTVVDDKGELLGVNIAPGLKTAISALSDNTAQLPEVPPGIA
jgi:type III pantothenate kinase